MICKRCDHEIEEFADHEVDNQQHFLQDCFEFVIVDRDKAREANKNNLAGWENERGHLISERDEARKRAIVARGACQYEANRAEAAEAKLAEAELTERTLRYESDHWRERTETAEAREKALREALREVLSDYEAAIERLADLREIPSGLNYKNRKRWAAIAAGEKKP